MHQNVTYGYIWAVGLKNDFFLVFFMWIKKKKTPVSMN